LKPLLEFAATVIPPDQLGSTSIHLLATAGMRLLSDESRDDILRQACHVIQSSTSFLIDSCAENVKVITGEEEGLYGWIAVNYLMDGFDKHARHQIEEEPHASTYGFLDMGGASTQIAFEPSESERIKHADNLLEVQLQLLSGRKVRHPVFVTTWLGFGTNQARDRYIDQRIKVYLDDTNSKGAEGADAMIPVSDQMAISIDDPCLPKSLLLSEPRHSSYTLRGTGDFAACVRQTEPLLNKQVACLDSPCLFNGVHVPAIDFSVNHFIGISEYWYSTQDVWSMGEVYDFIGFERNAMEYCSREWSDIMKDHSNGAAKWRSTVELSRLESQCFKAAWITNVLHEGIGIPRIIDQGGLEEKGEGLEVTEEGRRKAIEKGLLAPSKSKRPPSFQSINQVGGVAISWTLGRMVLEVSKGATLGPPSSSSFATAFNHLTEYWPNDFRATLTTVPSYNALGILCLLVIAIIATYILCLSPIGIRRRNNCIARVTSLNGKSSGGTRRNSDMVDSSLESGDASTSDEMRSPFIKSAFRNNATLLSNFRYRLLRLSSTIRTWSRPSSANPVTGILPMNGASYPFDSMPTQPFRPRVRQLSTPVFQRTNSGTGSALSSPTSVTATSKVGNTYWNDAPNLSEREKGVQRSTALTFIPTSTPPPMSSSSTSSATTTSRPTSRPTTPISRTASGLTTLTKLKPKSKESSPERAPSSTSVSSASASSAPTPTPPALSVYLESSGDTLYDYSSATSSSSRRGLTSRSNSQVNLSNSKSGQNSGSSSSSSNRSGGDKNGYGFVE
jgi:Golgi apyrase